MHDYITIQAHDNSQLNIDTIKRDFNYRVLVWVCNKGLVHCELELLTAEVVDVANEEINIGKSIKLFRKQRNITQEQLSNYTGLSRSYISDLENNRRDPSLSTLINISDKLGISLVELLVSK